jgi:hypothetical protein
MAKEMKIFETRYHQPEYFNDRIGDSTMSDFMVDDDEWQLAVWYMKEHETNKANPRAIMDVNHRLFSTTGTFRASHRDGGFLLFSHNDFTTMFGQLPTTSTENQLGHLHQCPYEFDDIKKQWKNTLTQTYPLIFHFAGNDWLCACQIFERQGYSDIYSKFESHCHEDYPHWQPVVNDAVRRLSNTPEHADMQIFLKGDVGQSVSRELQHGDSNGVGISSRQLQYGGFGQPDYEYTSNSVTAAPSALVFLFTIAVYYF